MTPYEIKEPLLQVNNVSLAFGQTPILRNVNAVVRDIVRPGVTQGQVIAFLGPSGRGKTVLSKILAGLQRPTDGAVLVNNPPTPVRAGMVGYVTQNYLLRRNRTLLGNLILAAKMHHGRKRYILNTLGPQFTSDADAKEKAMQYVKEFELESFVNLYPAQLSGGQRQRVAIAQQLLCSDHYLIMDEPFASLDLLMKERVCDLITRVALLDELNTLIIVSHDIPSVLKVADTAWLLGQDRNANGALIPGSYIKKQYDLMSAGICWNPGAVKTPAFTELVRAIEDDFRDL